VGFRTITRRYVPIAWRDDVIAKVGGDVEKWNELVKSWIGHNYNPGNVEGMLDAFSNGGLKNGNGKSYQSENQRLPKGV